MEYNVNQMVETRLRIAELRNELRVLKQRVDNDGFLIEKKAIEDSGGNYGKNAEERERFLKGVLLESTNYVSSTQELSRLQCEIELEEAKLDAYRDLRKEIELNQRDKMIEANITIA
jgi:hypothetical protein